MFREPLDYKINPNEANFAGTCPLLEWIGDVPIPVALKCFEKLLA